MSTFVERPVACPHCGTREVRTVAESLHGPRVPDVVAAIESGSFQQYTCERCDGPFVVDHPFVFLDFEAGVWITVHPLAWEAAWKALEAHDRQTFQTNMIEHAPRIARRMAEGITVRTVFGLMAFREKLLCAREAIDDRVLECWKLDLLRHRSQEHPFHPAHRPRLVSVSMLSMEWEALCADGEVRRGTTMRASLDHVANDRVTWSDAIGMFNEGTYVDVGRYMIGGDRPVAEQASAQAPVVLRTGHGLLRGELPAT